MPWDISVWKKPCPGGEEGHSQAGSEAAWGLQVARCVHVFDLRFDMRRERHWAAGGTEKAATTYLLCFFLCFVPDGLMIRDIDR